MIQIQSVAVSVNWSISLFSLHIWKSIVIRLQLQQLGDSATLNVHAAYQLVHFKITNLYTYSYQWLIQLIVTKFIDSFWNEEIFSSNKYCLIKTLICSELIIHLKKKIQMHWHFQNWGFWSWDLNNDKWEVSPKNKTKRFTWNRKASELLNQNTNCFAYCGKCEVYIAFFWVSKYQNFSCNGKKLNASPPYLNTYRNGFSK